MGVLVKACGIVAVFGALNWVALSMAGKDTITMAFGPGRTTGGDALMAIVGLSALFMLVQVFKPAKARKK